MFFEDRQCAKKPGIVIDYPWVGALLNSTPPPLLGLFEKNKSSRSNPIVLSEE